jgi:hypothetical protein
MSHTMVKDSDARASGFSFIVVGLLFSLALHGALLGYFFLPYRTATLEESQEVAPPLTVSDRLAAADSAILEGSAVLIERVKRKRQEMFAIVKETPEPSWTLAGMPRMFVRAAERVKIDLKSTSVVPANDKRNVYSITMEVTTTPERVFEDLLTLGHWVGIGTARSKFASENLLITVHEKNRGPAGRFVIPTRDCRLLSAGKLSAENFIARGRIEETG